MDCEEAASRIYWFNETGGHCRREQISGSGHLGWGDTCIMDMVTLSVDCVGHFAV